MVDAVGPSSDAPVETPVIEDIAGAVDIDSDSYFDHREFAARASLEDEHYWHLARREVLLQTLQETVPDRALRILEIGCGPGTVATYLNEHGYNVDYADVHYDALVLARARARARLGSDVERRRFLRIDICHDEIPPGYDVVLILDVIEHLPNDADALSRIHRALRRSDGPRLLILTVPAFPSLWSPYDVVEHHKRRYTRASARLSLEACDFDVERMTYFFLPLYFAAGALKLVRSVGGALRHRPPPEMFTELIETRSHQRITEAMMGVLRAERAIMRKHDLPLGTSLLCVARA